MYGSEEKRPCLEDAIDSKEMCGSEEKRPCLEDAIDSKEMCGSEEKRPCLEKDCIIAGNAKKCDSLAKSESKATDSEEMCGSEEKRPCLEKDCIIAAGHADVSRDLGEDISNEERTQNSTSNCDSEKIRESQVSQREKSTGFKRQHLVLGINAVTRLLEQRQLAAGLVCSSSPTLLYQHLLPLVAVTGVPFAAVPELSGVLSRCLGIRRAMCLGIRVSDSDGSWRVPDRQCIFYLTNPCSLSSLSAYRQEGGCGCLMIFLFISLSICLDLERCLLLTFRMDMNLAFLLFYHVSHYESLYFVSL